MLPLLAAVLIAPSPEITFDYEQGRGLMVTAQSVPIVQGSFFQYYEAGWTKGYFTSTYGPHTVRKTANGVVMEFKSDNGQASGIHTYTKANGGFDADLEFRWSGAKPVKIEHTLAILWAPVLRESRISGGSQAFGLPTQAPRPRASFESRQLGAISRSFTFDTPIGKLTIDSPDADAGLFDTRNYDQDWSEGRETAWLGLSGLDIEPGKPLKLRVSYRFAPKVWASAGTWKTVGKVVKYGGVVQPVEARPLLIPQPKSVRAANGEVSLGSLAATRNDARWAEFWKTIGRRFESVPAKKTTASVSTVVQKSDRGPESYRIRVAKGGVRIEAGGQAGVRNALRTLAKWARVRSGDVVLQLVDIEDWPSLDWRGVHWFVGPQALGLHSRMIERVLAPVKLNQSVLQCERTDWKATPEIKTGLTMSREDLVKLFERYRAAGIEPTPLIQSFGHMEWLFANNKNLDLAHNPSIPYAIDPRKPRANKIIEAIWDEAVELLNPKAMHFGLDEVDMRGFPDDPQITTDLWKIQIPWLGTLANKHGREMMLWGDKGLAPGEAPDAALGDTKEHAQARRDAIPKGAWITDWHYKNDPNPTIYTSLALWKREGFRPIAATWNRPNNIYGFTHAAIQQGAGLLQTTWAGYTANDEAFLQGFPQFAAYILAGEYAWSGSKTLPADLSYQPEAVLYRWMFAPPAAVKHRSGSLVNLGFDGTRVIDGITFAPAAEGDFAYALSHDGANKPLERTIGIGANAKGIAVGLSSRATVDVGTPVAEIELTLDNGDKTRRTLRYGYDVRAESDPMACWRTGREHGISVVRWPFTKQHRVVSLKIRSLQAAAGLKLFGVSLMD